MRIFEYFAETGHAPTVSKIAADCGLTEAQTREALLSLNDVHALFLDPGTFDIHIANPFSGVPTDFVVTIDDRIYWANCAWDSFGVVAALQSRHGQIRAVCAGNGEALQLEVRDGEAVSHGEIVHFLVPFSDWYNDIVFT